MRVGGEMEEEKGKGVFFQTKLEDLRGEELAQLRGELSSPSQNFLVRSRQVVAVASGWCSSCSIELASLQTIRLMHLFLKSSWAKLAIAVEMDHQSKLV